MARPPSFGPITDIRFITNYYLLGCAPPFEVIIETSREPALDLVMLFIGFDEEEWIQEIFSPGRGRRRKPSRKGRKRRRGLGVPDWNSYFANKVRVALPYWDGIKLPGSRFLFRLWGIADAIGFTVAIVEGLTKIGFANIWGVFKIDTTNCTDFGRIARQSPETGIVGTPGPGIDPVGLPELIYYNGFDPTSQFSTSTGIGDFVAAYTADVGSPFGGQISGRLVLFDNDFNVYARSDLVIVKEDERRNVTVSADIPEGRPCNWGWEKNDGFVELSDQYLLAFTLSSLPWEK